LHSQLVWRNPDRQFDGRYSQDRIENLTEGSRSVD
jgi:hypothetical protein